MMQEKKTDSKYPKNRTYSVTNKFHKEMDEVLISSKYMAMIYHLYISKEYLDVETHAKLTSILYTNLRMMVKEKNLSGVPYAAIVAHLLVLILDKIAFEDSDQKRKKIVLMDSTRT